jgi:hypothetical protein
MKIYRMLRLSKIKDICECGAYHKLRAVRKRKLEIKYFQLLLLPRNDLDANTYVYVTELRDIRIHREF